MNKSTILLNLPNCFSKAIVSLVLPLVSLHTNSQTLHTFQDSTTALYGFKNKAGKVVIEPQFALEQHYRNLLFGVTDSGWVAINAKGNYLFTAYTYDNGPDYFSNGLIRVVRDKRIGYANKKGKIVIQPVCLYAEPFKKGRADVSRVPRHIEHDPKKCNHYHETYDVINRRGRIVWDRHDKYNPLRETPRK